MVVRLATIGGVPMTEALAGFFNDAVTVLEPTSTQDSYGEMVSTWAALAGHCDLPCMIGPFDATALRLKAQEFRTSQALYEVERRRILLQGYYPGIDQEHRVRFDDRDWAVINVVHDVSKTWTILGVEIIEPGAI